jgi:hypothetical protein
MSYHVFAVAAAVAAATTAVPYTNSRFWLNLRILLPAFTLCLLLKRSCAAAAAAVPLTAQLYHLTQCPLLLLLLPTSIER